MELALGLVLLRGDMKLLLGVAPVDDQEELLLATRMGEASSSIDGDSELLNPRVLLAGALLALTSGAETL
ncbi:hypothetical protein ABTM57_20340, partial [Acinetobacter baumannii]